MRSTIHERVRAGTLDGFAACVRSLRGDPEVVFRLAGLDSKLLAAPQEWISFRSVLKAYGIASRMLAEPAFGIKMAKFCDLSFLGPLLLYARHAKDLKGALADLSRFLAIQNTAFRLCVEPAESSGMVTVQLPAKLRADADHWVELTLLQTHRTMNEVAGQRLPVERVLLRHAPLRPLASYTATFGADTRFEQPVDGLQFDHGVLGLSMPHPDAQVHDFMERYLSERVPTGVDDLIAASHAIMETLIPASQARLEVVAEHLRLHPRTFQRRLQALGYSFSEVLDEKRRQMAERLLRQGELTLTHVALCLGYAEQSAFNHAFERWHGVPPSRWLGR